MNKDSKGFGERVARYRTIREISQTKLAQILDVSTNTIQRIEGGYETKTDKVLPLCIELQISPNELFGYGDCFSELDPILTESLKDIAKTGKSMSPEKQMKFANALKKYVELIK